MRSTEVDRKKWLYAFLSERARVGLVVDPAVAAADLLQHEIPVPHLWVQRADQGDVCVGGHGRPAAPLPDARADLQVDGVADRVTADLAVLLGVEHHAAGHLASTCGQHLGESATRQWQQACEEECPNALQIHHILPVSVARSSIV